MANFQETSFIPQQPLLRVEGASRRRESVNLALVLSLLIFFVTLCVAGGVYLYKGKIVKDIARSGQELSDAEKSFDVEDITVFKDLQTSLRQAKQLVDSHTIFSVILDMLEAHTAENIGLTSLSFAAADGGVQLTLSGLAPSYAAVYFQVEEWRNMVAHVKKVVVTGLTLDERTGVVAFSVHADIDPGYLQYSHVLEDAQRTAVVPPVIQSTTTSPLNFASPASPSPTPTTPTKPNK